MLLAMLGGGGLLVVGLLLVALLVTKQDRVGLTDQGRETTETYDPEPTVVVAPPPIDDSLDESKESSDRKASATQRKRKKPRKGKLDDGAAAADNLDDERVHLQDGSVDEEAAHAQGGTSRSPRRSAPVGTKTDGDRPPTEPADDIGRGAGDVDAAAGIDAAEAFKVLKGVLDSWRVGTSAATFAQSAPHIGTLVVPQWQESGYELDKYQIAEDPDFKSTTERRIWVTMSFRDQGVAELRVQFSLKVGNDGRWLIAPVP